MKKHPKGFTLIELLVVITIIAVLASVAVPVYSVIQSRAKRTKALAESKQIHLALAEYAIDEDGIYPRAESDSNEAFRQLFDRKFQDERIFYVAGCAYHNTLKAGQTKPDNDVGQPPNYEQGLERGENHYAYITGLNNGSKGALPLIADGFTEQPGVYSEKATEKGGVWEGEAAIIVRCDGSAKMEKPDGMDLRIYEKRSGQNVDIFSSDYGTEPTSILNPQ
jgi:prepilin-type N-terminal cleavage/methylation domain-containing protein